MAFRTSITTDRGQPLLHAYVKASIISSTAEGSLVKYDVWEDEVSRNSVATPVFSFYRRYPLTDLSCENPLDYAYQLADASGEWPDATWNV